MTRGQIAIITENGILTSDEFNGNMYPEEGGYGAYVLQELDNIIGEEDFREYVKRFNDEFFQYDGQLFFEFDESYLNMQEAYYDEWSSDYVYIKNLTDTTKCLTDAGGRKIYLGVNEKSVFHYGSFYIKNAEDIYKRIACDELLGARDVIYVDMIKNYENIRRICEEYDDKNPDLALCDIVSDEGFVYGEGLEDILKHNSVSTARMRYFLGNTYEDGIYLLNSSGNLANIEESDITNLIDRLSDMLENSILSSVNNENSL